MLFSLAHGAGAHASSLDDLSPQERRRAARFHDAEHGRRFVVAHLRLRALLGAVLEMPPGSLQFATGEHGKPHLAADTPAADLQFNLSHSGDWGLVGWCRGLAIGVDVEGWRAVRDQAALVRRYFSGPEIAAYESLPAGARDEAFFNCWSRKEAYVKAIGRGLGLPLDSFDVSLEAGEGARILRQSPHAGQAARWSLAAPDLAALRVSMAVVVEGERCRILPLEPAAASAPV